MRFGVVSDKGRVRETNEDSYKVISGREGLPDTFIVADGMGGHNSGELASRMAVDLSEEYLLKFLQPGLDEENILPFICNMMTEVNRCIYLKAKESEENFGMGTTFVIGMFFNGKFFIGHVGDSRVYLLRNGSLQKLTTDHSYIEELIKNGSLSREEARNHPRKNVITRALGCEENVDIDTYCVDVDNDDLFVLCTDGLTNMLSENDILAVINSDDEPQYICSELVKLANERGGEDNITVIIVKNS
ncbi:Stp1/IreP family PP2C-type Ser/Thr phosphatase [Acetivibrio clariflavus]|uniref:Serine/threonine protein phosphatase n=1 Tax=Acetivibrio clariflavus (strain DSM 19732 / NBRC 101661 / EBR45) TaxID=720554 RepID=G8M0Q5_ACECE|nr:Stp1/IreP family PP2C-type Ser/Thr phosphatase [Acetivibrio clariflavus]AEV69136.1 serine/threonine protein phosphatase [Acetivibrio clariflavus DSM 19732]